MTSTTFDTITDKQIRDLRTALLYGECDGRQLHGLVDCHDALGRSHRRKAARGRCAEILNAITAEQVVRAKTHVSTARTPRR